MQIKVLFFASLRELTGIDETVIDLDGPASLQQIWDRVTRNKTMPGNTLCALNMEYVKPGTMANDGDEVAYFPPVTGG